MRDFDSRLSGYATSLCAVIPDPVDLDPVEQRLAALEALASDLASRVAELEGAPSSATAEPITWIAVSTTPYLVSGHNIGLLVVTAAIPINLRLPSASDYDGESMFIKDASGNAGTNNITVTPDGSDTIDDDATLVIDSDYAGVHIKSNGTGWEVL